MGTLKVIMFYINTISTGGAERVILQLARHFAESGYRSILVTSSITDNEYPVPNNVERISIEGKGVKQSLLKRNITRILFLRKLCRRYKPLAIVSFMPEPCFRAQIATIGLHTKNIVSVRNDPKFLYQGLKGFILGKVLLSTADGCVFQTEEAKEWFPKKLQNRSAVILNDVDHIFFETKYKGGKDIINLGRLDDQKNQKLLIQAFSKIADKYPEINLSIYGIGELKEYLSLLIKELGMEKRVYLKGYTQNAPGILSNAGMFVLSSNYEGMPNALMEALAVGVPSISTDCPCGGPKVLIKSEENGILVPVGDVDKLSAAIDKLLSNPNIARSFGDKARELAKKYETTAIFSQWKNYVEGIINNA